MGVIDSLNLWFLSDVPQEEQGTRLLYCWYTCIFTSAHTLFKLKIVLTMHIHHIKHSRTRKRTRKRTRARTHTRSLYLSRWPFDTRTGQPKQNVHLLTSCNAVLSETCSPQRSGCSTAH